MSATPAPFLTAPFLTTRAPTLPLLRRLSHRARDAFLAWQTSQVMANLDEHLCNDIGHPHQDRRPSACLSVWTLAAAR